MIKMGRKIIEKSDYTIEEFIERISVNGKGRPLFGDCLTYACAFDKALDGDGVFCIFIPSREDSDGPMHAAVKIDSAYYDARGEVGRDQMILTQYQEMREGYKQYIRREEINEGLYQHVVDESYLLDTKECGEMSNYDEDLFEKIYQHCLSELDNLESGGDLSKDVTETRGPDF